MATITEIKNIIREEAKIFRSNYLNCWLEYILIQLRVNNFKYSIEYLDCDYRSCGGYGGYTEEIILII